VSAPSFQCIFLRPDAKDDGIVHAYELLRLDLSGLDLVTFSACETALGRFDSADNLRGIPAALLIAGVSTIVGTLWNAESRTASRFFTAFYRIPRKNGSKKQAFYEAQAETRLDYPKYRDWGAFQLIGSWQ
jgi:CHAT domain-containing protein